MPTRITVLVVAALLSHGSAWAQPSPSIRAHAKVVTITDGRHVKKGYWYVMPEKLLDIYYVEIPLEPHTVTFTTDVESISFSVTPGSRHPFVIELDGGVEAHTEVRASFRSLLSSRHAGLAGKDGVDTIPFTLGDNDKIYVQGRINGGSGLTFQFDLGSGGSIIKKSSVSKVQMQFDGTAHLQNSDGDNVVPSSSANQLEIAGLSWGKVGFLVADNMTWREDALIGNVLFQDKVVEIDYDRMVLAIHDTLPSLPAGWIREEMILDGVVPFVRGALMLDGATRNGWFMLDTGAYTSILNADRLSASSKIAGEVRRMLSRPRLGPTLSIAGHTFAEPNYSVRRYDSDSSALGLLGNDVLKRFNLIVDNRRGAVYLRPNRHMQDRFRNPEYYLVRTTTLAVALAGVTGAWFVRRRVRHTKPGRDELRGLRH